LDRQPRRSFDTATLRAGNPLGWPPAPLVLSGSQDPAGCACIPPGEPPSQNQPDRIGVGGVTQIEAYAGFALPGLVASNKASPLRQVSGSAGFPCWPTSGPPQGTFCRTQLPARHAAHRRTGCRRRRPCSLACFLKIVRRCGLPVVDRPSVAARPAPWGQARRKRPGSTSSAGRPLFALNKTHFGQPKSTFKNQHSVTAPKTSMLVWLAVFLITRSSASAEERDEAAPLVSY
jgi:hypothetical protein